MNKSILWWLALLDVTALPFVVEWIIWRAPPRTSNAWIVLPVWLVVSFLIHRDTPKTLGWRVDNFVPALRRATLVLAPMAVALVAIGFALGARVPTAPGAFAPRHF